MNYAGDNDGLLYRAIKREDPCPFAAGSGAATSVAAAELRCQVLR